MQAKTAVIYIVAALVVISLGTPQMATAARSDMELNSLRGVDSMYLIVQSPSTDMASDGLTKDMISGNVQKQLESAGIKVVTDTKDLTDKGAILLIALSSVKGKSGLYACNVDAQVIQIASLARDPKTLVPATTWTTGMVAIIDPQSLSHLQERIKDMVDEFINDYKSANIPVAGATSIT